MKILKNGTRYRSKLVHVEGERGSKMSKNRSTWLKYDPYILYKKEYITRFLKMVLPTEKAFFFLLELFDNFKLAWHIWIDFYFHMIYGKSK